MKKEIFLIVLLFFILFANLNLIIAQDSTPLPSELTQSKINPKTGLPTELEKLQEIGKNLSKEEQRKQYLKQEWTKILAEHKIFGPVLFYTNNFFSFFNPIWKIIFGIEFSWSWAFIFSMILWIILIVLIYTPIKSMSNLNIIFSLLISMIISSLVGVSGVIQKIVDLLTTMITNIWLVWVSIIITILLVIIYYKFIGDLGKDLKEQSRKEKIKRAEEQIISKGKLFEKEYD